MWKKEYKRQKRWYYKHKKKKGLTFLNKTLLYEIKSYSYKTEQSKDYITKIQSSIEDKAIWKKTIKECWEFNNPERVKARKEKWYLNNWKEYYVKNKEKINEWQRKSQKKRYWENPQFRLKICVSVGINDRLRKRLSGKNGKSILEFLPYTIKELMEHLENKFDDKMTWDNYGSYWHIDHIIPDSYFKYKNIDDKDFKECWALKNLQPLEKIANIRKNNRYIG